MGSSKVVAMPIAVATLGLVVSCGAPQAPTPATVTVTSAQAAGPAPVVDVTLPDVTGKNAEIARDKLEDLGLTKVELASTNPNYQNVIMARNWTVVAMEPAAGSIVKSDDPIILKVYKD